LEHGFARRLCNGLRRMGLPDGGKDSAISVGLLDVVPGGEKRHQRPGVGEREVAGLGERSPIADERRQPRQLAEHNGTVFSYNGSLVSPSVLTSMLSAARQEGTLKGDLGPMAALLMKASGNPVSGLSPGEVVRTEQASLAVQYLDLRG